MTEDNEYYAYFTITGEFDPGEITKRLGVEPTKCWRKGDEHPKTGYERKFSRWSLFSRLAKSVSLEEHIRDVIAQMDERMGAFQSVSKEFGGSMQLVGYFHTRYPGLRFEPAIISGLGRYSMSVDFDFYYLYSDAREGT